MLLFVYVSQASDDESTAITIVDETTGVESQLTFDRSYGPVEIGLALAKAFPVAVIEFDEIPDR